MPPSNGIDDLDAVDRTGYDPATETYHAVYDGSGSLSTAVVEVVSAITGTPPEEMDFLYTVVDPDALDGIFRPRLGRERRRERRGCVMFSYEGCEVSVYWDGKIVVSPPSP